MMAMPMMASRVISAADAPVFVDGREDHVPTDARVEALPAHDVGSELRDIEHAVLDNDGLSLQEQLGIEAVGADLHDVSFTPVAWQPGA